jgi:putative endonuclease
MYYVYILYSHKLKKRYVGSANDLRIRIKQHNDGNSAFTKGGKPWKLIYYEGFISKHDALLEERFLKSGKGRERISHLLTDTLKMAT